MNDFNMLLTKKSLYRLFESLPGIISWSFIALAIFVVIINPFAFVCLISTFTLYWAINCFRIMFNAFKGLRRIETASSTDWKSRLEAEYPEWQEYYYCAIIPFASESITVLRPTVKSIADSDFPIERRILCLGYEHAIPGGRVVAERLRGEFGHAFAHIYITEHTLKPGELKGKASNQNHCGRFLYDQAQALGIDPAKVLFSSNDADVVNDPKYQSYLLHTYLSSGIDRDRYIYQPIPTDYTDFWSARFFSRIIISTGVIWRLALQVRSDYRCTVYSFYSMTLKTLKDIGFWDTDVIPEDERTMFKAIGAFGTKFKVIPLFMLTRGSPVCGDTAAGALKEQYVQIRRWAWGASEFAHSMMRYRGADEDTKRALRAPICNQLRTSTEWSLSSLALMFAGYLPRLAHSSFRLSAVGRTYPIVLSVIMSIASSLVIGIIVMDSRLAPPKPEHKGRLFSLMTYAQWILAPAIGLMLSSIPAIDSQTRLILNKRIAYVESRKEKSASNALRAIESPAIGA